MNSRFSGILIVCHSCLIGVSVVIQQIYLIRTSVISSQKYILQIKSLIFIVFLDPKHYSDYIYVNSSRGKKHLSSPNFCKLINPNSFHWWCDSVMYSPTRIVTDHFFRSQSRSRSKIKKGTWSLSRSQFYLNINTPLNLLRTIKKRVTHFTSCQTFRNWDY